MPAPSKKEEGSGKQEGSEKQEGKGGVQLNIPNSKHPPLVRRESSVLRESSEESSELIDSAVPAEQEAQEEQEEPSAEEADAEDPLPEGWVSYVDEESGATAYYNESTGENVWERPTNDATSQLQAYTIDT